MGLPSDGSSAGGGYTIPTVGPGSIQLPRCRAGPGPSPLSSPHKYSTTSGRRSQAFFRKFLKKFFRILPCSVKTGRLRSQPAGPIKKLRQAERYQQGPGHPRFPGLKVLHMQLAHLQSASASLGLVDAVAIRYGLVKVRVPALGALPSADRVLISRPCGPLRTCLRAGGTVSHRNHLPVRV